MCPKRIGVYFQKYILYSFQFKPDTLFIDTKRVKHATAFWALRTPWKKQIRTSWLGKWPGPSWRVRRHALSLFFNFIYLALVIFPPWIFDSDLVCCYSNALECIWFQLNVLQNLLWKIHICFEHMYIELGFFCQNDVLLPWFLLFSQIQKGWCNLPTSFTTFSGHPSRWRVVLFSERQCAQFPLYLRLYMSRVPEIFYEVKKCLNGKNKSILLFKIFRR